MDKEKALQSTLTDLQDNASRLKQKKEMKDKQLKENEKQVTILNRQLARIASANTDFERLELELKQAVSTNSHYCSVLLLLLFCRKMS